MPDTQQPLLLIIDDNPTNIDLLRDILSTGYRFGVAKNGIKALEFVKQSKPDLILLDVMMPEMDGFEVCRQLKNDARYKDIEVIFITALSEAKYITQGFEVGAVDYITKPFMAAEVAARVQTHLSLREMKAALSQQNVTLEKKVQEQTFQIQNMFNAAITSMARMAESRDPYTAGHQHRVSEFACGIARQMGLSKERVEAIRIASLVHDIGKIRIPVSILNRPGELMAAEWALIKTHAYVGYTILKDMPAHQPIAEIVYQHHEREDGSGYPRGLKGDKILLEAKILAVADVTEAISSHRPYRPARPLEVAIEEINSKQGILFDPEVVASFMASNGLAANS